MLRLTRCSNAQRFLNGRRWGVVVMMAVACLAVTVCHAAGDSAQVGTQIGTQSDTQPSLSTARVQARLDALKADDQLDAATRDQAVAIYKTALSRLAAALTSRQAAAHYQAMVNASNDDLAHLREQIKQQLQRIAAASSTSSASVDSKAVQPEGDESLESLTRKLSTLQIEQSRLRSDLSAVQMRLGTLARDRVDARRELTDQKQALARLNLEWGSAGSPSDVNGTNGGGTSGTATGATSGAGDVSGGAVLNRARVMLERAQAVYLPARIQQLSEEINSTPQRNDLLEARRKLVSLELRGLDGRINQLAGLLDAARQQRVQGLVEEAQSQRQKVSKLSPLLQGYASQTIAYGRQISQVASQLSHGRHQADVVQDQLAVLRDNQLNAEQILHVQASGEAFGQLLLTLRSKLPATQDIERAIAVRQQTIAQARLSVLMLDEQQDTLDLPLKNNLAQARQTATWRDRDAKLSEEDRAAFAKLVEGRRAVLEMLQDLQSKLVDQLVEVNSLQQQLISTAESLTQRLDERLIWLPSTSRIGLGWLSQIGQSVMWLVHPSQWLATGKAVWASIKRLPLPTLVVVLVFIALLYWRATLKNFLTLSAQKIGRVNTDRFRFTPQALGVTLLLALALPLLLGYLGWLLVSDPSHPTFAQSLGHGLLASAVVMMLLRSFQLMCIEDGLFGAHFKWPENARKNLGLNLWWLMVVECIAACFVAMTQTAGQEAYQSGLGRLAFIAGSAGLAVFMYRVFHLRKGITASFLAPGSWGWRSRGVWFFVLVAVPVLLGLLACWGYYKTALMIQSRLFTTAWVMLVALIFYHMGMRWVVVAHRRLAVKRARETREKTQAVRALNEEAQMSGEAVPLMLEEPDIDLSSVSEQTRTLLRMITIVGLGVILWMVWSQLVPALGVLNDITLWHGSIMTEQGVQAAPITLLAVVLGVIILVMTFVAARNLPGLLEIIAIQRFSLDSGTRYAISAILRYVIIVAGLLIAFDQIGIQWSKMQWIVAALGVGLGFGLQEVVANFVSGMIILFERPVRVGDTVTVHDLSGTISRIQIRATTIVDWDNREILVPNKSFITEQVVNWTLSDPVTRLVLKIGVKYGSDTVKAQKVMMDVVKANAMVLETPAPSIFFLGFGESSLNFDVRVFVHDLSKRMSVLHELHTAIHIAFNENGIEIPYPQRDLHIRSSDANLPVLIQRSRDFPNPLKPRKPRKYDSDANTQADDPSDDGVADQSAVHPDSE